MAYDPSQVTAGAEVTVVTGTQFAVNTAPPVTPTSTPTTGAGSATSTTPSATSTTTTTNPNIAEPSASNARPQPWDPRACSAGTTPTAPVANQT